MRRLLALALPLAAAIALPVLAVADTIPVAIPTGLPSIVPSVLPKLPGSSPSAPVVVTSPPATAPLAAPPSAAPAATPSPVRSAERGAGGAAGTAPSPVAATPAPVVVAAGPDLLQRVADTPLGPAPPIAGLALLALAAALALRRRLRAAERERVVEAAKVGFLKVASHELRTPLTVIRGYVAMAADGSLGALPEGVSSILPTLEGEVGQLERLVEQMLLTARLDEQLLRLERRRVDLRAAVAEVLAARPPAPDHRVLLETGPLPVPVRVDPDRLADIVGNLVDNAIKFSPEGSEITVRVDRRLTARLSVRDHGLGIAAADLPVLFTRFGRLVTPENSHIFGSGLGLYLVRELARRHGGQVRVASTLGRGSTFTVELPLDLPLWARLLPARRLEPRATEAAG